jgi:hypothetical protein
VHLKNGQEVGEVGVFRFEFAGEGPVKLAKFLGSLKVGRESFGSFSG